MSLVALQDMPASVRRAYEMFTLVSELWNPTQYPSSSIPSQDDSSVNEMAYYDARRNLVDTIHTAMQHDPPLYSKTLIEQVLSRLGMSNFGLDDIRFYLELKPSAKNHHRQVRMHLFYGGEQTPIGKGHGHVMLYINPDGTVASVSFTRRAREPMIA